MFRKLKIYSVIAVSMWAATAMAGPPISEVEELRELATPLVEEFADGLSFAAPDVPGFVVMNVRVYDLAGNEVLNVRSQGEPVELFSDKLPDGKYQYQSVIVSDLGVNGTAEEPELTSRNFGTIEIRDGSLVLPEQSIDLDEASTSVSDTPLLHAISGFLDIVVPSASAQLNADSATPHVYFDDTGSSVTSIDWMIEGNASNSTGTFFIEDGVSKVGESSNVRVVEINSSGGTATENSLVIQSNGDLEFHDGSFTMEGGAQLGIGTITPSFEISIADSRPEIELLDESDTTAMHIEYDSPQLAIEGETQQDIVTIDKAAPGNSIGIADDGTVNLANDTFSFAESDGALTPQPALAVGKAVQGDRGLIQLGSEQPYIGFFDEDDGTGTHAQISYSNGFLGMGGYASAFGSFPSNRFRVSNAGGLIGGFVAVDAEGDLGIGTSTSDSDLTIQRPMPSAQWADNDTSSSMTLEYSNNFMRIKGDGGQDLGKMHTLAPVGSFTTDSRGRTGYGTANPAASFNVKYRGAHGSVPVFLAQANNNDELFRINLNGNATLAGSLTQNSDRNAKTAIVAVDAESILNRVVQLPISQWQYKDAVGVNHIGPMAQDFHAAFGLGDTDKGIAMVDSSGVALAAIKALADENQKLKSAHRQTLTAYHEQRSQILAQDQQMQGLLAEVAELRQDRDRLARLEAVVADLATETAAPLLTAAQ